MKWLLVAFLLGWTAAGAHSHDWYSGTKNPASGQSCCGRGDCYALTDYSQFSEDADFYLVIVRERFRPQDDAPVIPAGVYKFPKQEAMPAAGPPEPGEIGVYACIVGGLPRCLFFSSGS